MELKKIIICIIIGLSIVICGCSPQEEGGEEEAQQEEQMPGEIEEIENLTIEIMQQADLIPLVEMLGEKAPMEQEENGGEEGENDEEAQKENNDNENGEEQGNNENNRDEVITFEETILGEVLEKERQNEEEGEKNQGPPSDTEEIWDNIKDAVKELHGQWDDLKPQLAGENISPHTINSFEETMDTLTVSSTKENYFSTLTAANQLTEELSRLMVPFAENSAPAAYEMKYHTRNVLLAAEVQNHGEVQQILDYMEELKEGIGKDLEEQDAAPKAEQLNVSFENFQGTAEQQNIDLLKVKAGVLMETIIETIEELEQQE